MEETEWTGAAAGKAYGGPGRLRNYKLCRRKGNILLLPIKQQIEKLKRAWWPRHVNRRGGREAESESLVEKCELQPARKEGLASVCLSVCICEMGRTMLALSTSQAGTPQRGSEAVGWHSTAQHTCSREEGRKALHQDGGGSRGSHGMDTLAVTPRVRAQGGEGSQVWAGMKHQCRSRKGVTVGDLRVRDDLGQP